MGEGDVGNENHCEYQQAADTGQWREQLQINIDFQHVGCEKIAIDEMFR